MDSFFVAKPNLQKTIMFNILLCEDYIKEDRLLLQTRALLETGILNMNDAQLEQAFEEAIGEPDFDLFDKNNSSTRANVIAYQKLIVDSKSEMIKKLRALSDKNLKEALKNIPGDKIEDKLNNLADPLDDLPEFKNVRIIVLYTHSGGHVTIGSNEPETSWSVDDIIQLLERAAGTSVEGTLHAILLGCDADIFMRQVKEKLDPYSKKYTFYAYEGQTYSISNKYDEVVKETNNIKVLLD